jgi:hypothetical protein
METTQRGWLSPARRSTAAWIAAAFITYAGVLAAAWLAWPAVEPRPSAPDRVALAAELLAWPAALVLAMIVACFRLFDREEALDTLAGAESPRFKLNQRVLSGTIEQLAAFAPALCAFAASATGAELRLVPIAVFLFTTGRLLFWIGYHIKPEARAFGYQMTFTTSVLLAGLAVSRSLS